MYYLHEKNIPNFVFVTARCPDPTINPMYLASRLGIQTCGACGFLFDSPAAALARVGDSDLKRSPPPISYYRSLWLTRAKARHPHL
jgi:hypothetical protein